MYIHLCTTYILWKSVARFYDDNEKGRYLANDVSDPSVSSDHIVQFFLVCMPIVSVLIRRHLNMFFFSFVRQVDRMAKFGHFTLWPGIIYQKLHPYDNVDIVCRCIMEY